MQRYELMSSEDTAQSAMVEHENGTYVRADVVAYEITKAEDRIRENQNIQRHNEYMEQMERDRELSTKRYEQMYRIYLQNTAINERIAMALESIVKKIR